jgi:general secretion pathway protein C
MTSLLFVILLSLSIASGVIFFMENMGDVSVYSEDDATIASTPRKTNSVDLTALNLFGQTQAVQAPAVVDAPETKLNLELQGVFLAEVPEASTAIVAEKNKSGELFGIGDKLPGNATLSEVFHDHILIRRGTRVEKLMFPSSNLKASTFQPSNNTARNTAGRTSSKQLQKVRDRIAQRNQKLNGASRNQPTAPGTSLRKYMSANEDKIRQNPGAVLAELGMSPVSEGEAKGYKVGGSIPQSTLTQAGLQQGDVILSVNGKPVGNAMNDTAMIEQAMASKRVRVEVQRDTRRFFLTVPVP